MLYTLWLPPLHVLSLTHLSGSHDDSFRLPKGSSRSFDKRWVSLVSSAMTRSQASPPWWMRSQTILVWERDRSRALHTCTCTVVRLVTDHRRSNRLQNRIQSTNADKQLHYTSTRHQYKFTQRKQLLLFTDHGQLSTAYQFLVVQLIWGDVRGSLYHKERRR